MKASTAKSLVAELTPLHVIACGALAREITQLIRANGWEHVVLRCLPAILHNSPEKIVPEVTRLLDELPEGAHAFVAYADCGTGGQLQALCKARSVPMLDGPHCYAVFETREIFAEHTDEIDAFYLTDFIARQFEAFVWRPLGLDRHPELRDLYFTHYTKLVYLAQTDDPDLDKAAKEAAERLGLAYERRATGFGDLALDFERVVSASG
ncbi:MAG: DUF1638 domain-containing protein [Pseudomonadota bacterium]